MIGTLLLLGAVTQAAICQPASGWPLVDSNREGCPQVYRIHGSAPVERGLNLVILPDGFTADQIDDYRCAAGLMVEKLASIWPFNEFSDSINAFRIDLVSTTSGPDYPARCGTKTCPQLEPFWPNKDCQCRSLAQRSGLPPPLRGEAMLPPDHAECLQLDLDVRGCPSSTQECQVLWPEGEGLRKLWPVARCAPAHDIVLVLSNSGIWAGGGSEDMHPPLAVATLLQIGEWTHRSRLLAHELGHTLGLLDEYAQSVKFGSGEEGDRPGFHEGRNLVRAEPGALPTRVPWEETCTPNVAGLTEYAAGRCFTVCGCNEDCDLPHLPEQPVIGLFEGGFYNDCRYYRPSQECKMQSINDRFCGACALYIEKVLKEMGLQPNTDGPMSEQDPDPGCPLDPLPPS